MFQKILSLYTLSYWNHNLNHVILSILDFWIQRKETLVETIKMASKRMLIMHYVSYYTSFKINIALLQKRSYSNVQGLKAFEKK